MKAKKCRQCKNPNLKGIHTCEKGRRFSRERFTVRRLCGNPSCNQKKLNDRKTKHVLVSVALIEGEQDFNCCWVQCTACGHHAAIALSFEVKVGKVFNL